MATGNVKNAKTLTFHDGEQQRQIVYNNNKTFWDASFPIFLPLHIFCCGGESDDKSTHVLLFCNLCAIFSLACLQIAISYRIWDFQWLMDSQCCELICRVVDWWDNRTNCFQCHKRRGLKGDDIVRKYVRSLIEDPSSSSNNIRNWEQPPPPTTPALFSQLLAFNPNYSIRHSSILLGGVARLMWKTTLFQTFKKPEKRPSPPQRRTCFSHNQHTNTSKHSSLCPLTPELPPKNCFCMIFLGCDFVVERRLKDPCISKLNLVSLVLGFCFATTPPRERESCWVVKSVITRFSL